MNDIKNNEELFEAFRSASRLYSYRSILMHEAMARKTGLSATDQKYLRLIIRNGAMTAGELSKLTGLTTGAVTGVIERLRKKKFVITQFHPEDRRKILIIPNTQVALKALEPLFTKLKEKTKKLLSSFTEIEILAIQRYFIEASAILKDTSTD